MEKVVLIAPVHGNPFGDADDGNGNGINQGDGNDDYNFGDDDDRVQEMLTVDHCLKANIFGVYCAAEKCAHKRVLQTKGSSLWIPSRRQIGKHLNDNKCGFVTKPNALGAETSLRAEQIQLHNQLMRSAPQQVDSLIAAEFPPNCTILGGS